MKGGRMKKGRMKKDWMKIILGCLAIGVVAGFIVAGIALSLGAEGDLSIYLFVGAGLGLIVGIAILFHQHRS